MIADRNNYIKYIISNIHSKYPNDSVCVLSRTNSMLKTLFDSPDFIDSAGDKVKIKGINNFYFDALTIHRSKGTTYDWSIIMPLTKSFPSEPKQEFWAKDIVRNLPDNEQTSYAEQRRLFYVA
ncbi:MAG: hypothetical protein Q4Q25_03995, partial [Methanocorpusculum sp.]|nr:hypothetical protein [Methanocorpusculum sp.]